jgi:hypothetical protein
MKLQRFAKLATSLVIAFTATYANAISLPLFSYSSTATEAYFVFQGKVGLRSRSTPSQTEAQQQIREQIRWMQSHWRRNRMASLRPDWQTTVTSIEKVSDGLYRVSYQFSGTTLILNGTSPSVEVVLPVNPDTVETSERAQETTCQDPDHGGGAFWYYWNPNLPNCNMVRDQDYYVFTGSYTRSGSTVQSYPEYNRMFVNGSMRGIILYGKVNATDSNDPNTNYWSYVPLKQSLQQMGFQSRQWTAQEVRNFVGTDFQEEPFIEEYNLYTQKGWVQLIVFYGNTGLREDSKPFQKMLKYGLETASFISYGGHAGTGKNLNLSLLRQERGISIHPRTDMYQVLHMSACFPYAYYVPDFFRFKATSADPRGSKNLDILAEGVEGSFGNIAIQTTAMVRAIVNYGQGTSVDSYQTLLNSSPAFSEAMFSVSGDEDNPTSPQGVQ